MSSAATNYNDVIHFLNVATEVSINDFDGRLKIQKLVYLAEELGHNFGFAFDWYARGPYSPSLTRTVFESEELDLLQLDNAIGTENERRTIDHIRRLIGDDLNDTHRLELFASVWYVLPYTDISNDKITQIIEHLLDNKPFFTREEYLSAIQQIQEFRNEFYLNQG